MKRPLLLLSLLALTAGCAVLGRVWEPEVRPLVVRLSSQADAEGPEFMVEAWVLELSREDEETLNLVWILSDCWELADGPLPASDRTPESSRRRPLPCFGGRGDRVLPTVVPVRGGTDGFQPKTSVLTEPEKAVVFQSVSNRCSAAVFRHAPPFAVRASDRIDASVPGCVFSASVVPSGDWNRFDLHLAVDLSAEDSNEPMPLPRAEPTMSVYPRSSACVIVPPLRRDGPFRLFLLKPDGPASDSATQGSAKEPRAESAESKPHAEGAE